MKTKDILGIASEIQSPKLINEFISLNSSHQIIRMIENHPLLEKILEVKGIDKELFDRALCDLNSINHLESTYDSPLNIPLTFYTVAIHRLNKKLSYTLCRSIINKLGDNPEFITVDLVKEVMKREDKCEKLSAFNKEQDSLDIPISQETIDNTLLFINTLPLYLPTPTIIPEIDGTINIEWYINPQYIFSISIDSSDILYYGGIFNEDNFNGIHKVDNKIPLDLVKHIERFI